MRSFLGIPIVPPPALLQHVATAKESLDGFRIVSPDKWHLTLAFMPQLLRAEAATLIERCSEILHGQPEFRISVNGFGAFPSTRNPSVVWLRLTSDREVLSLYSALASCLPVSPGERFHPHITIARRAGRFGRSRGHMAFPDQSFAPIDLTVNFVALFESLLSRRGSSYHILHRWRLALPDLPRNETSNESSG